LAALLGITPEARGDHDAVPDHLSFFPTHRAEPDVAEMGAAGPDESLSAGAIPSWLLGEPALRRQEETFPETSAAGRPPLSFNHPEWTPLLRSESESTVAPWATFSEEPVDYFLAARLVDPNELMSLNVGSGVTIGVRVDLLGPGEIPEMERLLLETGQDPVRLGFLSTSLGVSIDF
jgi:hypothetical protein